MPDESLSKFTKVNVPNRSGFNKSFHNILTAPVGALVPLMCDEVIPNTRVNLKLALQASLPPLASDTFMRCNIKTEAFFVPYRILYGGFASWLTNEKIKNSNTNNYESVTLPYIYESDMSTSSLYRPGSLADYLGIKFSSNDITYLSGLTSGTARFNIFPFLAYHLIYDEWYRNSIVTNKIFTRPTNTSSYSNINFSTISNLPYSFFTSGSASSSSQFRLSSTFNDGTALGTLRYRNFGADYFTSANPNPQLGNAQTLTLTVSGGTTSFSIADLRAANSVQQWLERNGVCGYRLTDYVRTQYGANLSDGVAQRPLFLGHQVFDVYSKGVDTSASTNPTGTNSNPFAGTVGAQAGKAYVLGNGRLIEDFTAQEPGCIMVLASLCPRVTYASGILRQMQHYCGAVGGSDWHGDMANPLLQNVGLQPIYSSEMKPTDYVTAPSTVFGYTDRYADYMTREDELHGLLRDGESLESFALQRTFDNSSPSPTINSSFLLIPNTYLDQVTGGSYSISNYGTWIDSYLDYRVSMPLQRYCIPSLQDPSYEHGHELTVRKGGNRID